MTQEKRTERITVAVTPTERRAIKLVAALSAEAESGVLRTRSLNQVMAEFRRATDAIGDPAA